MTTEEFSEFKKYLNEREKDAWEEHSAWRGKFEERAEELSHGDIFVSCAQARQEAFATVRAILCEFEKVGGISFDPSHGIGHAIRDYVHAGYLSQFDRSSLDAYVRIVGGTLHDLMGCVLVERFAEHRRVVRHAEASALIFRKLAEGLGIAEEKILPVYYAIAAHTNYLDPMEIEISSGEELTIEPYRIFSKDGLMFFVHAVREVDRCDFGPCFFMRHYFSILGGIENQMYDSNSGKFYKTSFADHMRPLFRSEAEIEKDPTGATARESFLSFADSQNSESIYGRYDCPKMVESRDSYREMALRIGNAFDSSHQFSLYEKEELLKNLQSLVLEKIEPTQAAADSLDMLRNMFDELPDETQNAWLNAFQAVIQEYGNYAQEIKKKITFIPEDYLDMPILGDVRRILL